MQKHRDLRRFYKGKIRPWLSSTVLLCNHLLLQV